MFEYFYWVSLILSVGDVPPTVKGRRVEARQCGGLPPPHTAESSRKVITLFYEEIFSMFEEISFFLGGNISHTAESSRKVFTLFYEEFFSVLR